MQLLVGPADLAFEEVTDLEVGIDFRGIAMGPLSIGEIRREVTEQTGKFGRYRWRIVFDFPKSEIVFVAAGFVQRIAGSAGREPAAIPGLGGAAAALCRRTRRCSGRGCAPPLNAKALGRRRHANYLER